MKQHKTFERDYKPFPDYSKTLPAKKRFSLFHYVAVAIIAVTVSVSLITLSSNAEAKKQSLSVVSAQSGSSASRLTLPLPLPETDISQAQPAAPEQARAGVETATLDYTPVKVKKGDTLTHIFQRAGLKLSQVNAITKLGKAAKPLTRLTPGQKFEIAANEDGELLSLIYHKDRTNAYHVTKSNNKLEIKHEKREYERRITHTEGIIKTSLFEAALDAGLSNKITMDLAYIFGWDIDFALDIRKNDRFVVLYEELYLDGERVGDGNILAAEFINQGKSYKAVRYTDKNGDSNYYSPDGKSMRKAFLRTPVDFTRISSRFGNRYHPTLKRKKKHKGVDYAAPRGTPIKAAGDGKIIWRGRKGGYGKTVIIKHGSKYSTLYAHMNAYNRKARKGSHVKQGQVIGYVGTTGRSTGPHLHYEFRVNGVHRNPLTVKLPDAESIKRQYKSDFLQKSRPLLAQLELIKNTSVAFNDFQ